MMFGDVGGLNDFLSLLISPVFGLFSEYLLNGDMVQKMFHSVSKLSAGDRLQNPANTATPKKTFKAIKPIKLTKFLLLLRACTFGYCPKDRKKKRLLKAATCRLDNEFDVVRIVR